MKIYFITSKMRDPDAVVASGSVIELDYMMRELQRLGHEIVCVTAFSKFNELTRPLPYKIIAEDLGTSRLIPLQLGIRQLLRKYENEADIFHIDGQYLYGGGLYRLLGGKIPVVAYLIRPPLVKDEFVSLVFNKLFPKGNYSLSGLVVTIKKRIRWCIERLIFTPLVASNVDFVTSITPLLLQEHYDFGLRPARHGLNIGDTYPIDEQMQRAGFTPRMYADHAGTQDKVTLYYSGRMAPGKGYDLLLAGFAKVKKKECFHLVLGGSGPEEPLVRQTIADFKLEPYVELTGWVPREKYYNYLRQTDIYVFTRWGTTLSALSLVEVTSFGIPSIVPAGTGLAWVAGPGALTFEPENPDDLARKIEQLGSDLQLRLELSRRAQERMRQPDIDPRQTIVALTVVMKSLITQPQ